MSRPASQLGAKAQIDFHCFSPECDGVVKFNLADIAGRDFQAVCPKCHRSYALDSGLKDKLGRMLELIIAIRKAEDILGDSNVSVNVAGGERAGVCFFTVPPHGEEGGFIVTVVRI